MAKKSKSQAEAGDGKGAAAARAAPTRPKEEIVTLDETSLELGSGVGRFPKGGGKGKSASKGEGIEARNAPRSKKPEPKMDAHDQAALKKYERGENKRMRGDAKDWDLNRKMAKASLSNRKTVFQLAKAEVLQTEEAGFVEAEGREKTFKFSQAQLLEGSSLGVAKKSYTFDLPYGPYVCDYTMNGQHLLVGGRKGQIAMMECNSMQISCELQLKETIRAVQHLHNKKLFAAAQKKCAYIYDEHGTELHCLKAPRFPSHMEFLPYHFLMPIAGDLGDLHFQDISIGEVVAQHKTRLGPCRSMRQNPRNAVVHMGHSNGVVTLWTPTVKEAVAKVSSHAGHVTGLGIHGDYMLTAGAEGYWKVWDMRKWEPVHTWKSFGHAVTDVDVSMTGLVSVAFGSHVQVWKDCFSAAKPLKPYLTQDFPGKMVTSSRWRPYEDVLGVGHSEGFCGLIVPGAGVANFDSFEANPFETSKQRAEKEVRSLLEKLQPDSIMLDHTRIGMVDKKLVKAHEEEIEAAKKAEEKAKKVKVKKKMKGKDKVGNKLKRQQLKKGREQREAVKARLNGEDDSSDDPSDDGDAAAEKGAAKTEKKEEVNPAPEGTGSALGRFYGKRVRKT